jgi:ketosteroid isomerase-like protein
MTDPLAAEREFFAALIAGDANKLDAVLSDDFILVDVMSGGENTKAAMLAAVGGKQITFTSIEPADARVRVYGATAVINGRTRMTGSFAGTPFTVASRYTHVLVQDDGRWRLVSAQGTPIAA